jgi:hypothetical protein
MRREIVAATVVLAVLSTTPTLFAANGPGKQAPPAPAIDPITEALCGRESSERARAEALDTFDFAVVPEVWRQATVDELRRWTTARGCGDGLMDKSSQQFKRRVRKVEVILSRLEETRVTEAFGASVRTLAKEQPPSPEWSNPDAWPPAVECPGCAALRDAAGAVLRTTAEWRKRKAPSAAVGPRLDALRRDETLIDELCAARPSSRAAQEMKKRFGYYTWTAGGAWLLAVADWFEQPEVADWCGR